MADPILAFRTVTECFVVRYAYEGSPPVLVPKPIALPSNPSNFDLAPGISQTDIKQTSCKGEQQIIFTYGTEVTPEISMSFDVGSIDIESLMINRVPVAGTNFAGWVYFSGIADATSVTGKASGKYGSEVELQVAGDSEAIVYYQNPLTKIAQQLEVVDSAPVGDQIVIGAGLELTLSSALAATGYNIYGWCPATFPDATYFGSESIPMLGVWAMGICFDETVKLFTARRCSFQPGGNFTKEPKRDIKMRVLADPRAKTGYGYDVVQLRSKSDCT